MSRLLAPEVLHEIERAAVPWALKPGRKHYQLFIGGHLVATFSRCGMNPRDWRGTRNVRAQVRRTIREYFSTKDATNC